MKATQEKLWRFTLTPAGEHEAPLSERLSAVVRYLEAHGVAVLTLTLALDASDTHPGEAERIRHWLKYAGRKAGLRASWPEDIGIPTSPITDGGAE